ncbi:translation initiation factor IF-2 [Patescibacteria group bacterium]|nr:translation initiation factor IF-2 [Patescibacteria group bacterium]MBU1035051.1 translation initiation factor IF-2 [Patescibacteria group bacterium]MBU1629619.1 translation initiation factor IF-2 [Patescibacteria group bacterium]MBU1908065.1 translation initiation factor IF-2 [Patescibacteria group bacterium]
MNVSDLARRLRVTPSELLERLPEFGFDIGRRAIKIDDRTGEQIARKWIEMERRKKLRDALIVEAKPGIGEGSTQKLKEIHLQPMIIVRDFAGKLNMPVTKVIQQLMKGGILATQNERLDFETASIIAEELGFQALPEEAKGDDLAEVMQAGDRVREIMDSEKSEDNIARPPVVVVMGHVDHGKTKTLDAIRSTNVMGGEAGGITQHIGAYMVEKKGRRITFIDTPGHEAFTVMRSRGARVADIAVLVVAADDGVQPQTKEAISIIQAAKLPFVVALNKMDKPEADPDRVLAQLAENGVTVENWGGKVPLVKISAKSGLGIDDLLDMILLVADLNADKIVANPERLAAGTVIEAHVDKGEGPVATVLVQTGTLKRNDYIGVAGAAYGRVRAMRDWNGGMLEAAPPGTPVKILGFKAAPSVGDILEVPKDPKTLQVKKVKSSYQVASQLSATKVAVAEEDKTEAKKMLNVVLKCDVLGSLEALLGMFEKIQHDEIGVEVIKKGLGNVTENDILRAEDAQPAVVYGFNVAITPQAAILAREKGVEVKEWKVIYDLFDDVVERLNAMVPPEVIVTPLGEFMTAAIFRTEHGRMVIGGSVRDGKIVAGEKVRVWRGEEPVGEGVIESVQSGKQNVKEAYSGQECGLAFKGKVKIIVGDKLEVYHEDVKERKVIVQR